MTKTCPKCGVTRSREDFGSQTYCPSCSADYQREYYRRRTATDDAYRLHKAAWRKKRQTEKRELQARFIIDYLAHNHCVDCGESDPVVLEFDHLDPSTKLFNISEALISEFNLERLANEIAKCQVLCANCHRRKTAREVGYIRWTLTQSSP